MLNLLDELDVALASVFDELDHFTNKRPACNLSNALINVQSVQARINEQQRSLQQHQALSRRLRELEAEEANLVAQSKATAERLGELEFDLRNLLYHDDLPVNVAGETTKQPFLVDDALTLAQRLALMSFTAAHYEPSSLQVTSQLPHPPFPHRDLYCMSYLHASTASECLERLRASDPDGDYGSRTGEKAQSVAPEASALPLDFTTLQAPADWVAPVAARTVSAAAAFPSFQFLDSDDDDDDD